MDENDESSELSSKTYPLNENEILFNEIEKSDPNQILIKLLFVDDSYKKEIFQNILVSHKSKIENSACLVGWIVFCFAKIFEINIDFDFSKCFQNIYRNELISLNRKYSKNITKMLNTENFRTFTIMKHMKNLIEFFSENISLFDVLKPDFQPFVNFITETELLNNFGLSSLPLLSDNFINQINMFDFFNSIKKSERKDEKELSEDDILPPDLFYSFHELFIHLQFNTNYQNFIIAKTIFPAEKNFEGGDIFLSLGNTSVLSVKHMIDILYKTVLNFFMIGEFQKGIYILNSFVNDSPNDFNTSFIEIKFWILSTIILQRLFDHSFLETLLPLITPNEDNLSNKFKNLKRENNCVEFIFRLSNDIELLKDIEKMINKKINFPEIVKLSFPFLFTESLRILDINLLSILKNHQKPLFHIIDRDRKNDDDFIYSYFIISLILKSINLGENELDDKVIHDIKTLLSLIENLKTKKGVIIDIFSLIFITVNDKFLFSSKNCEKLLLFLSEFVQDENILKYVQEGIRKIQIMCLNSNTKKSRSIEYLLVSKENYFYHAYFLNIFEFIEEKVYIGTDLDYLCEKYPNKTKLINTFRNVLQYLKSNRDTNEKSFIPDIIQPNTLETCYEIGLSLQNEKESLKFIISNSKNNFYKTMANKRLEQINHNHMKCVKKCQSRNFQIFSDSLTNLCNSCELSHIISFHNKINFDSGKKILLQSFHEYINHLVDLVIFTKCDSTDYLQKIPENPTAFFHEMIKNSIEIENSKITERKQLIENLEKILGSSIQEYILLNIDQFDENEVEYYLKNNKSAYLVYTLFSRKQITNDTSECLIKYIKNETSTMDPSEEELLSELKTLLEATSIDFESLIELSYQISSDKFIDILDEKLFILDIKELIRYSNEFGCDPSLNEKVHVLYDILLLGIDFNPLKNILPILIQKQQFELAKQFVHFYRYKIDVISIIRKEVLNSIRNKTDPEIIFGICPEIRSKIISSLPARYSTIFPSNLSFQFDESIPSNWNKSTDIITTLKNNLGDIYNTSNNEKAVIILKAHKEVDFDNEFVSLFVNKPMSFKKDDRLNNDRIKTIIFFLRSFHSVFRSQEKVLQACSKLLLGFMNETNVVDPISEQKAIIQMKLIRDAINEIKKLLHIYRIMSNFDRGFNDISLMVNTLYEFTTAFMFSKHSIKYSFRNFIAKENGEKFNKLCYFYDFPELALKIANAWHLKDFDGREDYAMKCLSLGRFEQGLHYAPNRRRTTSSLSAEQSKILSNRVIALYSRLFTYETDFVTTLSQSLTIDPFLCEFINRDALIYKFSDSSSERKLRRPSFGLSLSNHMISQSSPSVSDNKVSRTLSIQNLPNNYKPVIRREGPRVTFEINKNVRLPKKFIPKYMTVSNFRAPHFYLRIKAIVEHKLSAFTPPEHMKMLRHFLRTNSKITDQISYFVSNGLIDKAIKYIKNQTSDQVKWNLFFTNLFIGSYANSYEEWLKVKIKQVDPELKFFGSYLEKLLKFAISRSMYHLQLEVELILERKETAAITAISLSTKCQFLKDSIVFLRTAETALNSELSGKRTIRKAPSKLTHPKIMQLLKDIDLQIKFNQFCIGKGLTECSMNLFHSKYTSESMVVYLLKEHEYNLAVNIINHCNLSVTTIGMKLIDILVNEDDQSILSFVSGLAEESPQYIFEYIFSAMLMRLFFVFDNEELSINLINRCVKDQDFKCRLMIQFMKLEDAFQIAKNANLTHLMPLIGHLAQMRNLGFVVNDVTRLLARHKSLSFISK
ncbi:hypothetical protein TRFO_27486 [Tritrichomonas foetus]|uniref:Uncharacterized protein n=1 Tax=Tritrichomonas foetus TaxID=1144522 RepID=A0A1J4K5H7_9EUKA|nr:hypothetical protein TRFO_27486 [Tritrichomonas foetus]|eukprot:OHT04926.1 hypothetical protein TRFO_27486 [Tritrichomonas foetus]